MSVPRIVTVPGVRPVMQVAVGDVDVAVGQARYEAAHYDVYPEATYAGLDAQWTDDSCDVHEAVTWYGRERTLDAFDIGTAALRVANPAGLWDYPPTDPLTPLTLRPGRQIRVGVVVDDDPAVWLWHGWIDATTPVYDPALGPVVEVAAVCAKGEAGRAETARVDPAVGGGETVTARMGRYADLAQFPAHRRQFDFDPSPLAATALGGRLVAAFDLSARSAGGDVFGDNHGFLVYRGADWQTRGPGDVIDATIGNRGIAGEVCPNRWTVAFNRSDFTTRSIYGRAGETAQPAIDDPTNIARFGVETYRATDLETVDATDLAVIGQRPLRVRNFDLAPRVAGCTLDAARPGVIDVLRDASPFTPSMYACGHVEGGRTVFARTLYLTGIEHTISAGNWTARLALDDATPWIVPADTRYDTAHYDLDVYTIAV